MPILYLHSPLFCCCIFIYTVFIFIILLQFDNMIPIYYYYYYFLTPYHCLKCCNHLRLYLLSKIRNSTRCGSLPATEQSLSVVLCVMLLVWPYNTWILMRSAAAHSHPFTLSWSSNAPSPCCGSRGFRHCWKPPSVWPSQIQPVLFFSSIPCIVSFFLLLLLLLLC